MTTAKLIVDGKEFELPVVTGSEGEIGVDVTKLRAQTGIVALDPGYGNTGACQSSITFIDGEKGVLRYRGYPIEQLAESASFIEVCYLLINGELPDAEQLADCTHHLSRYSLLHEDMKKFFEGYPPTAHPMAIMSSMPVYAERRISQYMIGVTASAAKRSWK